MDEYDLPHLLKEIGEWICDVVIMLAVFVAFIFLILFVKSIWLMIF